MFKISLTDGSLGQFLNLFGIHSFSERGIAFYRPIFREGFHNIYFSIFGLNHLPFRIFLFVIHFINISLVYTLVDKIFLKKSLAFFAAFFFAIGASNVSLLYYLAGGIEASGAVMFALLTILFYQKYLIKEQLKFRIFSFIFFLFSLASHEIIIMVPFIIIGLILLLNPVKKSFFKIIKLYPYFFVLLIYLLIDFFKIGFSSGEQQYHFIFNFKTILNSFAWYSAWAFGIPEMLIDFVLPGFKLNPALMRYWGNYYIFIFTTFIISAFILCFNIIYLFLRKRAILKDKRFIFFLLWFPIGILPVIFLPAHKSTHYLVFVLPAFWTIVGFISLNSYWEIRKKYPKLSSTFLVTFLGSLVLLSYVSINLENNSYWAASRGRLAEKLINEVVSLYPTLPKGSIVYFSNDPNYPHLTDEWGKTSKQASFALNGSDGLQLLYKDPTLKVYYEDLGGVPVNFKNQKIYQIKAKID